MILQLLKLPDGSVKAMVEVPQRGKVLKYTERSEYYEADAVALGDTMGERVEAEALARSATTEFESYVKLNKKVPPEADSTRGERRPAPHSLVYRNRSSRACRTQTASPR